MKVINADLPRELSSIELHTFADEHIGDWNCDLRRLQERIEYVANTPNAYCVLNGDLIDNSHTHLPMVMKQGFFRIDPRNSKVACVEKLFVNTAANLDYGGYGEAGEFKPSSKTSPIIYLSGKKKELSARL